MIAMTPAKAWAQIFGHVKEARRDSSRTTAEGNEDVIFTAAQVQRGRPDFGSVADRL